MSKKEYLKKLFITCQGAQKNDLFYVVLPEKDVETISNIKEIEKELEIKVIIKIEDEKEKYEFFKEDHTKLECLMFYGEIKIPNKINYIKSIYLGTGINDRYTDLLKELNNGTNYQKYKEYEEKYYSKIYHKIEVLENGNYVMAQYPSRAYSEISGLSKEELWNYILKVDRQMTPEYIENLKLIRKYLNELKVKKLEFENHLGTSLEIGLSPYSNWATSFDEKGKIKNYPSCEIFTSPDKRQVNGKVVISRPVSINGYQVNEGYLEFEDGRLLRSRLDNDDANFFLLNACNKSNYCGEIALVSKDGPIASQHVYTNNVLNDENAGCHLAMGDSLDSCILLDDKSPSSKEEHNFNASKFHNDIVFGEDTTDVYAVTNSGRKKIVDRGIFRI